MAFARAGRTFAGARTALFRLAFPSGSAAGTSARDGIGHRVDATVTPERARACNRAIARKLQLSRRVEPMREVTSIRSVGLGLLVVALYGSISPRVVVAQAERPCDIQALTAVDQLSDWNGLYDEF